MIGRDPDQPPWAALKAAHQRDDPARVPFTVGGRRAGSVARSHLGALSDWPHALAITSAGVDLVVAEPERDAALADINQRLRQRGLIQGWRDECFAVPDLSDGRVLARGERAASRFWGSLTLGAHATGYRADDRGRPTHLWLARRALTKATDPGLWDNLIGGGVPDGQSPQETLVREGWEEAGLDQGLMQAARPARVIRLDRDIPHGRQLEDLHGFDLRLAEGVQPRNIDGEVERFECLAMAQALELAASARMTVDAALVTLDFALRHGVLAPGEGSRLAAALSPLLRSS